MREGGRWPMYFCCNLVRILNGKKISFCILFVLLVFLLVFEVDLGACSLDIFLLRSFVWFLTSAVPVFWFPSESKVHCQDLVLLLALDLIFPHPAQILEQTCRPVFPVPFLVQQPSLGLSFSPFVELSLSQFPSLIPPGRSCFSSVVIFCAIFHVLSTGVSAEARQCFPLMPKRALALSLPSAAAWISKHTALVSSQRSHRP
jgi:hypothetical protein